MSHKGEGDPEEGIRQRLTRDGISRKNTLAAVLKTEVTLSWTTQYLFLQKCSKSSVRRSFKREAESIQMEASEELGRGAPYSSCGWFI